MLLHAYWAKLECNIGKDLAAARGVWENALKKRLLSLLSVLLLLIHFFSKHCYYCCCCCFYIYFIVSVSVIVTTIIIITCKFIQFSHYWHSVEFIFSSSGSILEVWQHYISMEIEMGHTHEARSLYKRCYSKKFAGSGSEVSSSRATTRMSPSCLVGL